MLFQEFVQKRCDGCLAARTRYPYDRIIFERQKNTPVVVNGNAAFSGSAKHRMVFRHCLVFNDIVGGLKIGFAVLAEKKPHVSVFFKTFNLGSECRCRANIIYQHIRPCVREKQRRGNAAPVPVAPQAHDKHLLIFELACHNLYSFLSVFSMASCISRSTSSFCSLLSIASSFACVSG